MKDSKYVEYVDNDFEDSTLTSRLAEVQTVHPVTVLRPRDGEHSFYE